MLSSSLAKQSDEQQPFNIICRPYSGYFIDTILYADFKIEWGPGPLPDICIWGGDVKLRPEPERARGGRGAREVEVFEHTLRAISWHLGT